MKQNSFQVPEKSSFDPIKHQSIGRGRRINKPEDHDEKFIDKQIRETLGTAHRSDSIFNNDYMKDKNNHDTMKSKKNCDGGEIVIRTQNYQKYTR